MTGVSGPPTGSGRPVSATGCDTPGPATGCDTPGPASGGRPRDAGFGGWPAETGRGERSVELGSGTQPVETSPAGSAVEPEPAAVAGLFGVGLAQARAYVQLLAGPGTIRGLIGPREADRLWTRHMINSVLVAEMVPPSALVVDVGSGAGLPGIPLAIARPDCRIVLVEPLDRRVRFLIEALDLLELTNTRVVRGRAEQVITEVAPADVVTSRALAPLATVGEWSAPLLRPGGLMLAVKGASAGDEIDRDAAALARAGLDEITRHDLGGGQVVAPTVVVRAVRRDPKSIAAQSRRPPISR